MSKYFDNIINRECMKNEKFRRINDLRVDLNDYFIGQFGCKKPPCDIPIYQTLDFRRVAFELYLRYYEDPQYQGMLLVIARIMFKKTGVGHMTRFLRYIVQISDRHNIKNVAIEQTISDAGVASAKSFGFHNSVDARNWIISIDELQRNLSKKEEKPLKDRA